MTKKVKKNLAPKKGSRKGGTLLPGVQTHADRKRPSAKKLREEWRNKPAN